MLKVEVEVEEEDEVEDDKIRDENVGILRAVEKIISSLNPCTLGFG